jgi:hypothetical protein
LIISQLVPLLSRVADLPTPVKAIIKAAAEPPAIGTTLRASELKEAALLFVFLKCNTLPEYKTAEGKVTVTAEVELYIYVSNVSLTTNVPVLVTGSILRKVDTEELTTT